MFKSTKKFISIILTILMVMSSVSVSVITAGAAETDDSVLEEAVVVARIIIGDVNFDDDANIKDATQIQMYLAKFAEFNGYQLIAADTDKNDDVNIRDATNIQLYAAKFASEGSYVGEEILVREDEVPSVTPSDPPVTAPDETDPPATDEPATDPTSEPEPTSEPVTEPNPTTEPTTESKPADESDSATDSTDEPVGEIKYILIGGRNLFTSNWDKSDENNKMTYNPSTGRYEWVTEDVANNLYEYKVIKVIGDDYANGEVVASDSSLDTGNIRFTVSTTGTKVLLWFKPETGEYGQELTEPKFVVAGSASMCTTAWNKSDENNLMTYNASAGRFEKTYQLGIGTYEYKIARNGTEFVFTDTSVETGNIKFTVTVDNTTVTIWYKPNSNEHGREVVEPTATSPTTKAPTTAPTTTAPTTPTQAASTYPTEATPMKGIDVSYHNGSDIDFNKVKAAGIKFVIIRAGYGQVASQKDKYFETNYSKAKAAGLKVGAYWYSYASTTAAAITEANVCLSVISGKQFEFPIYFDLEESSQFAKGSTFCNTLVTNFNSTLEAKGYFTGLYMSRSPLTTYISSDVRNKYALWVAEYASSCKYTGSYGMWQYSSTGKVNGISGNVDMNEGYVDYSGVIRNQGFNGFPGVGSGGSSTPSKSIDEIAQEVLDGLWGNGDERRERLAAAGYDPDEVQKKVNELLYGTTAATTAAPTTTAPTTASTTSSDQQATYGTEAVPMKGIDVSVHNGGSIDFHKVKAAGIQFVIIRAGYGQSISQKDGYFDSNYLKAKAAGLKVGAYWYSYASTTAAAVTEANVCLSVISGKQFEFPIYFDLEESSQFAKGSTFCNTLITNFNSTLEAQGYFTGLYMSRSPLTTYISSDVRNKYSLWVAEYASSCKYTGTYGMWQYSSTGKVNGISGNVDMNEGYVDYSGVIRNRAFNNYPVLGNGITPQLPIDEIVKEVFDGKWGNGDERKQKLTAAGYDYSVVQYRVQEYLDAGTRP